MIINDGKKFETKNDNFSQEKLENILYQQSQIFLNIIEKKIKEFSRSSMTSNNNQCQEDNIEQEIKEHSIKKIADIMSKDFQQNQANFNDEIGRIKITVKDATQTIDILKHLKD